MNNFQIAKVKSRGIFSFCLIYFANFSLVLLIKVLLKKACIFIEVPDVVVPIIDTLPSTQTNSAKEDDEIAQENYSPYEMFQDLKNQRKIFEPDASRLGTRLKANQPKIFLDPAKNFGIGERSFLPSWYYKLIWLRHDKAEDCILYHL